MNGTILIPAKRRILWKTSLPSQTVSGKWKRGWGRFLPLSESLKQFTMRRMRKSRRKIRRKIRRKNKHCSVTITKFL